MEKARESSGAQEDSGLAETRAELRRLAQEQAALRRVATLVAQGLPPSAIFSAVSDEVARLFDSEDIALSRFESDGTEVVVVGTSTGIRGPWVVGMRVELDDQMVIATVARTGRPARRMRFDSGPLAESLAEDGFVAIVAAPILVAGRLWGVIAVATHEEPPPNTETRLDQFTELVATAIANAESHAEAERLAEEQAALRRVATLIAEGVPPPAVFSALSDEVGRLFATSFVTVTKYEYPGPTLVVVGAAQGVERVVVGSRWQPDEQMGSTMVLRTGRSARGSWRDEQIAAQTVGSAAREAIRGTDDVDQVASPIVVDGKLWGAVAVGTREPLPPDAEERLEKFTELLAFAIANADSRAELAASRARVIVAADDARRRIERDLHDGAQQRLVTLTLALRRAEAKLPPEVRPEIARVADELTAAVDELREISRGIHPSVLSEGGLLPALKALGRRSPMRVALEIQAAERLADQIEVAAYYIVAEALTNASKYANATHVAVSLGVQDDTLFLTVRDDGIGGADQERGSGLTGLCDRVEALGGTIRIDSPHGLGTLIEVEIPLPTEAPAGGPGL